MLRYPISVVGVLLTLSMVGCGTAPLQQDQPVYLQPGQGLAAITFDTLDSLNQVIIEPKAGGSKLDVTSVPVGKNIYLFPVPAGQYCFTRFEYGRWSFTAKQGDMACFEVQTGELSYSGTLAPRVEDGVVMTHQVMDVAGFRALLAGRYPIIAKQFAPLPEPPPPTTAEMNAALAAPAGSTAQTPIPERLTSHNPPAAGSEQISSWTEEVQGTRAQVIFFRNNTAWVMQVKNFELYDCIAVKQPCGPQKFTLILPPHATKQAMIIEPAQLEDAYSYRTRWIYGFLQGGNP